MLIAMADNYLEKKMEALQARKAKEARAKQLAWKKRMDAYRKKLEAEAATASSAVASPVAASPVAASPAVASPVAAGAATQPTAVLSSQVVEGSVEHSDSSAGSEK